MKYIYIFLILFFFYSWPGQQQTIEIAGNAQGTTYNIIYLDDDYNNYQN